MKNTTLNQLRSELQDLEVVLQLGANKRISARMEQLKVSIAKLERGIQSNDDWEQVILDLMGEFTPTLALNEFGGLCLKVLGREFIDLGNYGAERGLKVIDELTNKFKMKAGSTEFEVQGELYHDVYDYMNESLQTEKAYIELGYLKACEMIVPEQRIKMLSVANWI